MLPLIEFVRDYGSEKMSLLFPDLLFRLNVASLGGGESASDARSMLKGDLDLYADQNRNLAQLLELNEKKNKYLLQVIDEIQNKPKESQALVPVVSDSSQVQVTEPRHFELF